MIENNITATTIRLLSYLKLPVTQQTIKQELANHPSPASLLALSDALHKWKIKNIAYHVDINDFKELPFPFLVHLNEFGGQFGFVTNVTTEDLILIKENEKQQRVKLLDFKDRYGGLVLVLETGVNSGEPNYCANRIRELAQLIRIPLLIAGLVIVLGGILMLAGQGHSWNTLPIILLAGLKITGVITASLLLNQSFGNGSNLMEKLCRRSGSDCLQVLTSPGAKMAGGMLSWAELGFFYFASTGLTLILLPQEIVWKLLIFLNAFCICFSAYSLYYQYKVIKSWCLLCCTLLVLFYGEFLVLFFADTPAHSSINNYLVIWPLISLLIIPVLIWLFVKPYFIANSQVKQLTGRLRKFERNKSLFYSQLYQQVACAAPRQEVAIRIGQPDAEHIITIVSSPTCGPCALTHFALDDLLQARTDIQANLIFAVPDIQDAIATKVAKTLINLYQDGDKGKAVHAQRTWYESMNYNSWRLTYPLISTEEVEKQLVAQQEWCLLHQIETTPIVIVNGYQLPLGYDLKMLQYLL